VEAGGLLRVRTWGARGPLVVVLHGGPAATGEAAPIARGLSDAFRVLEPWQRDSGGEPLTVALHVADLHELVSGLEGVRPAIVGESWGAMLALAYAAAHPCSAGPLVLIGCGTFDTESRSRLTATLDERAHLPSPYDFDAESRGPSEVPFDALAHEETWEDMLLLQAEGVYPAAFESITSEVLMVHGTYDPHPGKMIRASLEPHLARLEYVELDACGHSPWRERQAREPFFEVVRAWLEARATGT